MAAIDFEQVGKVYPDGTRAVDSVDLDVPDGSFMALVGPSGCGKTTLLRMLAGLETVTEGTIRVGGRAVNTMPPKDRDIAMVFQNYALYPHMSVYDNMAFALKLRHLPKQSIGARVSSAAAMLGIGGQLRKKPSMLSGGQRQRVAMGRAMVREPQAFLMDEPLSNLDAKLRVQMRAEIARVQRELGVTTIFVTHDQIEAMTLGDRVAVLRAGELQQVDEPQELFERPANLFVAGFIGSPAMNVVEAALERGDGGAVAVFAGHRLPLPELLFRERPALERHLGRRVVLGIRPDDFEDVAVAQLRDGGRIRARVDLRETLGRQAYLHFAVDAPPVVTEDVRALAADTDASAVDTLESEAAAQVTRFVALVSAQSPAREGADVELLVDTCLLHFFEPETGAAIYD
jgi:multiple sugar transport system ATP-binding protein